MKDDVKKRVTLKVWGVVFCCMASRASHTKLVNALSAEGFLMAYQRFTAVRGQKELVRSRHQLHRNKVSLGGAVQILGSPKQSRP